MRIPGSSVAGRRRRRLATGGMGGGSQVEKVSVMGSVSTLGMSRFLCNSRTDGVFGKALLNHGGLAGVGGPRRANVTR
jgi:hypothetical protein